MKIQLNILMIRQARQEDKAELLKSEEIQTLKRKYGNVLRKYHEASQELAAFRRREERGNGWLTRQEGRSVENSLSLSP
jgi:ABC-type transporter MlaC component